MERELTEAERKRLGLLVTPPVKNARGWSKEQIKDAIKELGFSITGLEKALGVAPRSINQSLQRRSTSSDKAIAAFLNVHESIIWPNRYFVNGVAIHKLYNIETRSDDELNKLNAEVSKPAIITVIDDWHGTDGGPTITTHESVTPATLAVDDKTIVNDPFHDSPIYEDVSPMADGRPVSLPPGMKIS